MKRDVGDGVGVPLEGARRKPVVRWRGGVRTELEDWLTEEVPVAFEFNGIAHAVMLATPADLEDFALGFALAEGILENASELYDCEIVRSTQGITVQLEIASRAFAGLKDRRRTLAGRTGCGICGTEQLDQVVRPMPTLPSSAPIAVTAIGHAMRSMAPRQLLNQATGSVHAAAWCEASGEVKLLREDVGRHNALDKLVGALAREKIDAARGFIAVTSRASIEMVQKAAISRAPLLAAVSAPTVLAVETAEAAGLSLVGLVRGADLVVYAGPERVALDPNP